MLGVESVESALWRLHRLYRRHWGWGPELETRPRGSGVLQQDFVHVIDRVAEAEVLLQHKLGRPDQTRRSILGSECSTKYAIRVLRGERKLREC